MAHILVRKYNGGMTRFTAVIRIKRDGTIIHREARTFSQRGAAEKWAKHREVSLEEPDAIAREQVGAPTLRALIRWYIDNFSSVSKWQRSKQAHLELLERHPFTDRNSFKLTAQDLVNHVRERRAKAAGPATVANDLVWLGVVLRAARSVRGLPVNPVVVEEARDACRALRLTGKARKRTRRPTSEELQKLDAFFSHRDRRGDIPMRDIMWFAIHSARRQAEICRIAWRDNNERHRTGIVRDAKHPTAKDGNDRTFKYTPDAWAVVCRQPRISEFIFPHDPRSVSAAFTRACHVLGIENLRFHDLRHEATSRLFEAGYQIHEVAQFTLHDSWNELKRYANLKPENVRALSKPPVPKARGVPMSQFSVVSSTTEQGQLFEDLAGPVGRRH